MNDGFKKIIASFLVVSFLFSNTIAFAESVDDKFTQIAPGHSPGGGEFVHGTGYGKLLMRVMMFGAMGAQGVHYVPEGTDLVFAMLYAGGYNETSKLTNIKIRRRNVKELITVDLEDLLDNGEKIPKVMDGDIISVPFNWRKDMATIGIFTGFITAMTGFTLSIIALSK